MLFLRFNMIAAVSVFSATVGSSGGGAVFVLHRKGNDVLSKFSKPDRAVICRVARISG